MNNEDNENDSGREVGEDGRMIIESMLSSLLAVVAKSQSERTKEVLVRFFGTVLGNMITLEALRHNHPKGEACDVNELISQLIRARDESRESMKRHVAKGGSLQKTWHPLMDMEAAEASEELAAMGSMFDLSRVFDVSAKPKVVNALVEMPNPDIDRMDGHPGMA